MSEQTVKEFWIICEEQLQKYTDDFNNTICVHGFKVEYKVLDKTSVGLIYGLIMTYHADRLNHGDCPIHSKHIPEEIITIIKTLDKLKNRKLMVF